MIHDEEHQMIGFARHAFRMADRLDYPGFLAKGSGPRTLAAPIQKTVGVRPTPLGVNGRHDIGAAICLSTQPGEAHR